MSTSTQAGISAATPTFAKRKARTLIGWLPEQEGALWIAGREMKQAPEPAHLEACQRARAAVAAREAGIKQNDLFSPLPAELEAHIQALQANPKSARALSAAGTPRMVDLRWVCAAQPTVATEDAVARVHGISGADLLALAKLTLPLSEDARIPVVFDQHKNAWIVSSPNPNLRVAGAFEASPGAGLLGYGFIIEQPKSYLHVCGVAGRYFLRDGYHRAYGLLAGGITHVPALVSDVASFAEAQMPPGLLAPTEYLGPRPPMLVDYLSDNVAHDSAMPVTTKIIALQALELSSIG